MSIGFCLFGRLGRRNIRSVMALYFGFAGALLAVETPLSLENGSARQARLRGEDVATADLIFANGFERFTLSINDYLGQCSMSANGGPSTSAPQAMPFTQGTVVSLQAVPNAGFVWRYWTGTDGGDPDASQTTTVTMSTDRNVLACCQTADQLQCGPTLTVVKSGSGSGTVTSDIPGIDCGSDCAENFPGGTTVVLTAAADANSSFAGWSGGGCSGSGTCTVTIAAAVTVSGAFDPLPANYVFVTSTVQNGNLGSLAAADALCNSLASGAGLPGSFQAWLSSTTVNASARLGSARGWIRSDGLPVADQLSDLLAGRLFYPISVDQNKAFVGEVPVWTGTNGAGNYSGSACPNPSNGSNWTSTVNTGTFGLASVGTQVFTYKDVQACGTSSHLYCFAVDHVQVVAPAAVTARRAFVSGSWLPGGGIASADAQCATDATAASLPGTYKALLATSTASASSRFIAHGMPIARLDDTVVSATDAEFLASPAYLLASPSTSAENYAGGLWSGAITLTGTGSSSSTCNNWTDNGAGTAIVGLSGYTKVANWRGGAGTQSCNQPGIALVCLEE